MHNSVTASQLVAQLRGVRAQGKGFVARCPNHDDERQSLSIDAGEDGKLLLYCHAGCEFADILAAAGFDVGGERTRVPLGALTNGSSLTPKREVAVYPYVDENGAALYEVVRFAPKDFRIRRRTAGGGVVWTLGEVERVWYCLPAVVAAREAGRPILVVEGEKDCISLVTLGFTATTVAGGAAAPLPPSTPTLFSGANVVILPDNDEPGKRFGERIARSILAWAGSVKIVDLPNLPTKGDASDWVSAGGTKDELSRLIAEASPIVALEDLTREASNDSHLPPESSARYRVDSIRLSDVTPETVTWLWSGRIPWGKLTILEGDPGVGKSTLSSLLAAHVSSGRTLLPDADAVSPSTVLLLPSFEDGTADTVVPRLLAAGADLTRVHELRGVEREGESQSLPLSLPSDVDVLRDEVETSGAKLVLIDSLTTCLDAGVDAYKDSDVRKALAPLARVADETGVAVVVIRHFTKSARGNAVTAGGGSIAIAGVARVVLQVHKAPDDESQRILAVAKCNVGVLAPSIRFSLEDAESCAKIVWLGESQHTADDLVALRASDDGERALTSEVGDWLRETLRGRELPRQEVVELADKAGYRERTLQRAAKQIGVGYRPGGYGAPSFWYLRASMAGGQEERHSSDALPAAPNPLSPATRASPTDVARLGAGDKCDGGSSESGGQIGWTTITL